MPALRADSQQIAVDNGNRFFTIDTVFMARQQIIA